MAIQLKEYTIVIRDERNASGVSQPQNFSIDKDTGEIIPDNNYPKRPGGGNRTSEGKRNPRNNSYKRTGAGEKGGTEANEQLRAINPLMNKVTGGWWEKGVRLGRASSTFQNAYETMGLGSAMAGLGGILIAQFVLMQISKITAEEIKKQQEIARRNNEKDILRIKVGEIDINRAYSIRKDILSGRVTYKMNR